GRCLAISTPAMLPSVGRKTSAPRTCLTPLNTSPAHSPVNASRLPSRTARASLRAGTVRYTFTVTDFHRLPFAGLPAHPSTASTAEVRRFTQSLRQREPAATVAPYDRVGLAVRCSVVLSIPGHDQRWRFLSTSSARSACTVITNSLL